MSLAATVLIPTHDHGETLRASVASALRQTVSDIEVLVVGDGVPDQTRQIVQALMQADSRVRFFDHPKGPRHGEIYRHQALTQARGRIVCYLSDDDLFLPRHVEVMCELLERADFVHALATAVHPDGSFSTWTVDLALPAFRQELLEGRNRVPLSAGAHTLEAYRRLPTGWTPAPFEVPTDLHMWWKFLAQPGCRFQAGSLPTVLVFPAAARRQWNSAARFQELQTWLQRTALEPARTRLIESILRQKVQDAAASEATLIDTLWGRSSPMHQFVLQLFIPATGEYSEANSILVPAPVGDWVTIDREFVYPRTDVPLRIDPGEWPGLIQFAELRLSDMDGAVLWQMDETTAMDVQVGGTAVPLSAGRELLLVSNGRDPQVLLPPIEMPAAGSTVRLQSKVRLDANVWALSAAYCCTVESALRNAGQHHPFLELFRKDLKGRQDSIAR